MTVLEVRGGRRRPQLLRCAQRQLRPFRRDGEWEGLESAVRDVVANSRGDYARVRVALLRPLACAKVLRVPPVGRREILPLLHRNISRYFPFESPAALEVRHLGVGEEDSKHEILVSCAPAELTSLVSFTVEAAGLSVAGFTVGPAAELEWLRMTDPRLGDGRCAVLLGSRRAPELAFLEDGKPILLCPVPKRAGRSPREIPPDSLLRETVERAATLGVEVDRILRPASDRTLPEELAVAGGAVRAALGAACTGTEHAGMLTRDERAVVRKAARRRHAGVAAALLLLVAAGLLLYRWGLERELSALRDARAAMESEVTEALEARRDTRRMIHALESLRRVEAETPRWSPALHQLAVRLPQEARIDLVAGDAGRLNLRGRMASGLPDLRDAFEDMTTLGAWGPSDEMAVLDQGENVFAVSIRSRRDESAPSSTAASR